MYSYDRSTQEALALRVVRKFLARNEPSLHAPPSKDATPPKLFVSALMSGNPRPTHVSLDINLLARMRPNHVVETWQQWAKNKGSGLMDLRIAISHPFGQASKDLPILRWDFRKGLHHEVKWQGLRELNLGREMRGYPTVLVH